MNISDKKIYIQETETKPNKYACVVLICTFFIILSCWLLNEIGIFRVGQSEMRIGSIITLVVMLVPLVMVLIDRNNLSNPKLKFFIIISASVFTFVVGTMLTFHTTIMMLFPILFAMLYRSKALGLIATISSLFCTMFAPIFGYLLGTWDIPLFQELILIATNGGVATIEGGSDQVTWVSIGKIVLYLALPRLLMVGAAGVLLFNNIRISVAHVNNQILLNQLSHIDSLTGLFNQNYYKEMVEEIRVGKDDRPIGILFFDVNYLKKTNDTMGHEFGDILLKRSALSIKQICSDDNMMAFRVGGDEFLVYIDNANEAILNQKVSEWEDRIKVINEVNAKEYGGLICSMAVGYCTGTSHDIENVIRQADSYMYRNKARMKGDMEEYR